MGCNENVNGWHVVDARRERLKWRERHTSSACAHTRESVWECMLLGKTHFSVATVARLSLLLWRTEAKCHLREGGRGWEMERRERQLTFYKTTCIYASACIQLMSGDEGDRSEAGHVWWDATYLKSLLFDIAVHSLVRVCARARMRQCILQLQQHWVTVCTKTSQIECLRVGLWTHTHSSLLPCTE